jgi:plasmid stabilization system protein ParE
MKSVFFLPEAENDYLDAIKYYRANSTVSSQKFTKEIKHVIDRISRFPNSGI